MDRGTDNNDNLAFLRYRGAKDTVGTPKAMLRQFDRHLADQNWVVAQEGVAVKFVPIPDGEETFRVTRSIDRRFKELEFGVGDRYRASRDPWADLGRLCKVHEPRCRVQSLRYKCTVLNGTFLTGSAMLTGQR